MQKTKKFIKIFTVIIICFSFIITVSAADELIPIGHTTGIKLHSSGAIVISLTEVCDPNPAKTAGIAPGDVIKSIDGAPVHSNTELKKAIQASDGQDVTIEYMRDGKLQAASVTPAKTADGEYVLGILIRDSIAGIGTLTYLDPETNTYGALGHGISDTDTGLLIPVEQGTLIKSSVADVKKGACGSPGELVGDYKATENFADIKKNTESGIFGTLTDAGDFLAMQKYPVADKKDIKRGSAHILSNIEGDEVCEYEIEITSIYYDGETTKNMLIRATDPRLLEKTGGIVRGMSGSPIIQDGKLIGAVTHVLVNDPKKGYAIFIENMLAEAG